MFSKKRVLQNSFFYVPKKKTFFDFSKITNLEFSKKRNMIRFRPSRRVERVGREISVLKSGLNISGVLESP